MSSEERTWVSPYFEKVIFPVSSCYEGDSFELEVIVLGNPRPKVTWLKNGNLVADDDYYSLCHQPDGSHRLTFHYLRDVDDGQYECKASNEAGQVSCYGVLHVKLAESDREEDSPQLLRLDDIPCGDLEGRQSGLFILFDEGSQDEDSKECSNFWDLSVSEQIEGIIEDLTMAEGTASISLSQEGIFLSDESQEQLSDDKCSETNKQKFPANSDIDDDEHLVGEMRNNNGTSSNQRKGDDHQTRPTISPQKMNGLPDSGSLKLSSETEMSSFIPPTSLSLTGSDNAKESALRTRLESTTSSIDVDAPIQITEVMSPTEVVNEREPLVREDSIESNKSKCPPRVVGDGLQQFSVDSGVKITELEDDTIFEEDEERSEAEVERLAKVESDLKEWDVLKESVKSNAATTVEQTVADKKNKVTTETPRDGTTQIDADVDAQKENVKLRPYVSELVIEEIKNPKPEPATDTKFFKKDTFSSYSKTFSEIKEERNEQHYEHSKKDESSSRKVEAKTYNAMGSDVQESSRKVEAMSSNATKSNVQESSNKVEATSFNTMGSNIQDSFRKVEATSSNAMESNVQKCLGKDETTTSNVMDFNFEESLQRARRVLAECSTDVGDEAFGKILKQPFKWKDRSVDDVQSDSVSNRTTKAKIHDRLSDTETKDWFPGETSKRIQNRLGEKESKDWFSEDIRSKTRHMKEEMLKETQSLLQDMRSHLRLKKDDDEGTKPSHRKIWEDMLMSDDDDFSMQSLKDRISRHLRKDDNRHLDEDYDLQSKESPMTDLPPTGMPFNYSQSQESYSFNRDERVVEQSYDYSRITGSSSKSRTHYSFSESFDDDSKSEPVYDLYVAIADYIPDGSDSEAIPVCEGQIVEVLDSHSSQKWLVRTRPTKTTSSKQGWVPPSYLEKKTLSSTLKSIQEILEMEADSNTDSRERDSLRKRSLVVKELVETEEEFAKDMLHVVNTYIRDLENPRVPKEIKDIREAIFMNFKSICDFHNNVLIKGVQYYANEPVRLGKTFIRLERDFDMHMNYCRDEPRAQLVLTLPPAKEFFEQYTQRIGETDKTLSDHLKLPIQRINDYQLLFKELIKYSARLKEDCTDLQKALDLMLSIPQRAHDLKYINSIEGYKGNLLKLGRLLRHEAFTVTDRDGKSKERYCFFFKSRILVTKVHRVSEDRSVFVLKDIIKLPDVEIKDNPAEKCKFELHHKEKNFAHFPLTFICKTEFVKEAWLKELREFASDLAESVDFGVEEIEVAPVKPSFDVRDESGPITESVCSDSITSMDAKESSKQPPRFAKHLKPVVCSLGDSVSLECEVLGLPPATVTWLRNNLPLSETDRLQLIVKGSQHQLYLKGADENDAGLYTAHAANVAGAASSAAPVHIKSLDVPTEDLRPTTPGGSIMPHAPIFVIKYRDTEVIEGSCVTFMLKVHAMPEAEIKFFKDGKPMKFDERVKLIEEDKETFELVIVNVTAGDAGKYSCTAKNSEGESSVEANVTISAADKKVFLGIEAGSPIPILAPGEEPDFKWYRDGQEFEASERFKVMYKDEEDTLALVFQHVKPDDAGLYTCVASTASGNIACSAELTVQGAVHQLMREPEAPKITAELADTEVSAGGSAMLELKFSGFPKPKITWFKDSKEVQSGGRYRFLYEDDESVALIIKNVTQEDSGKYKVVIKNDLGEKTTTGQLIVKAPPKFKKQMKDMSAMLNETVKYEVEIEGKPTPEVSWYKDGQLVSKSARIQISHENELFSLVITKVAAEDSGSYSCMASNSSGKLSEFSNLTVNVPPSFLKEMKSIECKETDTIKFEVKVAGTPAPKVVWSKNGEDVKIDGKRFKAEQDERNYNLVIDKVTRTETGKYTCTITNEFGSSSSSADLNVNCVPEFNLKLSDKTVKEGDENVKFEVKVSGTPKPKIKWFIESMEITEKSNNYKITDEGETQVLIIKKVTPECSGKYTCQITNSIGEVKSSASVNVLTKPKFTQEISDKEVTEGETVSYTVKITGNPAPDVKWYKNNQEVSADAKIKIKHESSESWSLTMDCVAASASGKYECKAKNSEGESVSASKLIVNTKPTFEKGLTDLDAWLGLEAIIEVQTQGVPEPEVKWFKNGQAVSASDRVKLEKDGKLARLVIKETTVDDNGAYKCTLKNKIGEASTEGNLKVKTPEDAKDPICIKQLKDTITVRYNTTNFEAKILGNPKPDIKWMKDGVELAEGGLIHITETPEGFLYRLTVDKTVVEDMGKYSILATNEHGKLTSEAVLDVHVPPEIVAPMDRKIMPKGNTTFEVTVTGRPTPKVSWHRKGKALPESDKFKWKADDAKHLYTFICDGADVEDGGEYECVGENVVTTTRQPFNLLITTENAAFVTPLANTFVKPTTTAKLDVEVSGIPMPDVKWMRGGVELAQNWKIHFVQHNESSHSLVIDEFSEEDVGDYECKAISKAGETTCKARLDVKHEMPFFPRHVPKESCAIDGESFTLEAKIGGSPHPKIKWLKDGKELVEGDRVKIESHPDGTVRLTIDNAKGTDSGKYTLVISNETGEISSAGMVSVEAVPKAPKISEKLQATEVHEGSPLQLNARIIGYPKPQIKWLKDGKPVKPDRFRITERPDGGISFIIDDARADDAGKYTMIVKNNLGEATCEADVTVKSPPRSPGFHVKVKHTDTYEGFPLILEGKVVGYPQPTIKWMKEGQEIKHDGQKFVCSLKADGHFSLTINDTTPSDAGQYTCVAINSEGEEKCNAEVGIKPRLKAGEPLCAPSFITPLRDLSTEEGMPIKLQAHIAGNPVPSIYWTKNGEPLKSTERMLISFDGDRVNMEIKKAVPTDAGKYECKLENPEGSVSSVSELKVKKMSKPPVFTQRFPDMDVILGQDGKFVCRCTGFPTPDINWYFNDKPLVDSDKYKMKHEGDMYALYVKDCTAKDIGNVTCIASNVDGEEKCIAFLNVVDKLDKKPKAEAASFLKKLADCEVIEGMTAKFTACISGNPEPDFKWYKNGTELIRTDRIRFEIEPHGLIRLLIKDVQADDVGKYSLKISNIHGAAECEASLNYEGYERKPKKAMLDLNVDYEKAKRTGVPFALPDKPIISKMTDRRLTLSWKPSIPVGPRVPVTYIVEMCEVPDGDWFNVRTGIRGCCCEIRNLEPYHDYKFRIRVENKYGVSDSSPFATAYRTKLEPSPPKYLPTLPSEFDFRPETSQYFPKDFDITKTPHEAHAEAPRFLRQDYDCQYGVRNQPSSVQWYVYGYPTPTISWNFQDEKIELQNRYTSSVGRSGQTSLYINRFLERDVGIYECVAVNEHGEARQRVQMEISEPPVFSRQLDETTVMVRESVVLECRVSGTPYPEVKWYKDWHPLAASSRTKIEWKEPDLCILTINDTILKDGGLYSCAARNVAGMASNSVMLTIEENEDDYAMLSYSHLRVVKARRKPFEDSYDIGDELGRGTQGIAYHAVERATGNSYAAKIMHGKGDLRDAMNSELNIMNQLHDRQLIRAVDGFETKKGLTLITELASGGELLDSLCRQVTISEDEIAGYIRQVLWGLEHMHGKGIAHLGLTPGDLLLAKPGGDDIKICDFGLAHRLVKGKDFFQDFGMPEYVAPEIANQRAVSFNTDMWSVGVITYLLLSGISPFMGEHDRQTLQQVQQGRINFDPEVFSHISDDAKDFMAKLLVFEQESRMDVKQALKHPWMRWADRPGSGEKYSTDRLKTYYRKYKDWMSNSACKRFYRRRPLQSAFTHTSRMVYPPDEQYTPPSSPDLSPTVRSKPAPWDMPGFKDKIDRESEDMNYDLGYHDSESRYQQGPDTYLLQLRDVGLPLRLREYMRVSASQSPSLGIRMLDTLIGQNVTIRERRRFTDVMDEEIDDERKGFSDSAHRRIISEVSPRSETRSRIKELLPSKCEDGFVPFFREKIQEDAFMEDQDIEISCLAIGDPNPMVQWFRNDVILQETHRLHFHTTPEGRSVLKFSPIKSFDAGIYKAIARNINGDAICRARLRLGDVPGRQDAPEITKSSDTELFVTWNLPKDGGNSPIVSYELEYKESEAPEWQSAHKEIPHEFFMIRGLKPTKQYHCRVKARNKFGVSDFSVPSAIMRTSPEGTEKVSISKAMKHQQEQTESGGVDFRPRSALDYTTEDNPVIVTGGATTEKYKFISEIYRGQFSMVYKCCQQGGDRVFAAKAIDNSAANEEQAKQEFEIMRSLRHERLPCLYEVFTHNNCLVMVMEKLQGFNVITHLVQRHSYTEEIVTKIVSQILDAVQYLHFRNLIHLDLQPDNIVMKNLQSHEVKLVDMGSVRKLPRSGSTLVGAKPGLLDFRAPEVVNNAEVGVQADIWGLGVLTYILLSGISPFRGNDDKDTIENITFVRYRFESLYKEITPEATRFLMQIFKKTPSKRPIADECLEHKWFSPSELMLKKRERAIFLSSRLKEFVDEYNRKKHELASGSETVAAALGVQIGRSISVECDVTTTF